jgi:hypothetical protein
VGGRRFRGALGQVCSGSLHSSHTVSPAHLPPTPAAESQACATAARENIEALEQAAEATATEHTAALAAAAEELAAAREVAAAALQAVQEARAAEVAALTQQLEEIKVGVAF